MPAAARTARIPTMSGATVEVRAGSDATALLRFSAPDGTAGRHAAREPLDLLAGVGVDGFAALLAVGVDLAAANTGRQPSVLPTLHIDRLDVLVDGAPVDDTTALRWLSSGILDAAAAPAPSGAGAVRWRGGRTAACRRIYGSGRRRRAAAGSRVADLPARQVRAARRRPHGMVGTWHFRRRPGA